MPFYFGIDSATPAGRRTAQRLLALRRQLDNEVPRRTVSETLLLATWNIREFESGKYGPRSDECLYYIAEILSRFDLIAVQEVRSDLSSLEKVMKILGSWWHVIMTDVTAGRQGNDERLAFLYDERKVRFTGLAGEIVIPPVIRKGKKTLDPAEQLARTPYLCGFRAGWFKFLLCTVHIYYGKAVADDPKRVQEVKALASFLAKKADSGAMSQNLILLGDFNIFAPSNLTFQTILEAGFDIPQGIRQLPSNVAKNKHYDQIAFLGGMRLVHAGVFDFYRTLYKPDDESNYTEEMGDSYRSKTAVKRSVFYRDWRTYQMSDHLPMWVELQVDLSDDYLKSKS